MKFSEDFNFIHLLFVLGKISTLFVFILTKNLEILQVSASIDDKVSASVFQVSTGLNLITHVFCNTRLA